MKKVIEKKVYNTETATLIAEYWNGLGEDDFMYCEEYLYRTRKGSYFLRGSGGPLTKYSESNENQTWGISTIIPISKEEAYEWLEANDKTEAIEEYFSNDIDEA
ncbi:hypothetical protein ACJDT4_09420 [Clostridium neuense]|uniref:GNAT family acetyltransferase n=1 Tax=Clostridium neuense TaxID=1728934 RepID=A0ABW8TDR2_9CLOT